MTTVATKITDPFTIKTILALCDRAFEQDDRPRNKVALLEGYADCLPTNGAKLIQTVGLQLGRFLHPGGIVERNYEVLPFLHSQIVNLRRPSVKPVREG